MDDNCEGATLHDADTAKLIFRRETEKLVLLQCRLEIYRTTKDYIQEVAFNEMRLPTGYFSNNDKTAVRTVLTFDQAKILLNAISFEHLIKKKRSSLTSRKSLPGMSLRSAT